MIRAACIIEMISIHLELEHFYFFLPSRVRVIWLGETKRKTYLAEIKLQQFDEPIF